MKSRSRLVASVAGLVLVAACGSTVPLTQQASTAQQQLLGDSGTNLGAGNLAGNPTDVSTTPGEVLPTDTSNPTVGPTDSADSPGATAPTSGGSTAPVSTGPTTYPKGAPIKIGVAVIDYSALATAFGAKLAYDELGPYKAMFAYINSHGGLAGHQIVPYYVKSNGDAADYDTQSQEACSTFTQDDHVQVVITYEYYQPTLAKCLQNANVAMIDGGEYGLSESDLQADSGYLSPGSLSLEREAKIVFGGLARTGVINKKSVVGILSQDCADASNVNNNVLPALAKLYGFKEDVVQLTCYTGVASLGSSTNQIQSSVLKFRTDGVTQVFALTASEGTAITLFNKDAESQKYYPKYLVSSNAVPYTNSISSPGFPADMLDGMHAIGWQPATDLGPAVQFSANALAEQRLCKAMDPTEGGASGAGNLAQAVREGFFSACDDILLLQKILASNGGQTTLAAIRAGYESQGSSFTSAQAYGGAISVSSSKHDGAAEYVPFSYIQSCKCFKEDSAPQPVFN